MESVLKFVNAFNNALIYMKLPLHYVADPVDLFLHLYFGACVAQHVYGGQRPTWESPLTPSTMGFKG